MFAALLRDYPIVVKECDPRQQSDAPGQLYPDEEQAIARAVPKRRREFITGRLLARDALAELGCDPTSIPVGQHRCPVWPTGYAGSITHSDTYCAVAVARTDVAAAIGLDVEPDRPLEERLWRLVCTDRDRAWLAGLPESERGRAGKLLFSAKESAYKAQFLLTGTFLEFAAMSVEVDLDASAFRAWFETDVPPHFFTSDEIKGVFAVEGGQLGTAVILSGSGS